MTLYQAAQPERDKAMFFGGKRVSPPLLRPGISIRRLVVCAAQFWERERKVRRAGAHISSLDDHLLRDIGLERDRYMKQLRHGRDNNWEHLR